jgi:hypothetical protein
LRAASISSVVSCSRIFGFNVSRKFCNGLFRLLIVSLNLLVQSPHALVGDGQLNILEGCVALTSHGYAIVLGNRSRFGKSVGTKLHG